MDAGTATIPPPVSIRINPEPCRLAPPDRHPAHDFALFPPEYIGWTMFCRQCGEKR